MKKNYLILCSLLFTLSSIAQVAPSKYVVFFTDKTGSSFSVTNPSAFLSQRAIDRRTRQNISIKENDIPVNPSYVQSVSNTGVTVLNRSKWLNSVTIYTPDTNLLAQIRSLSFVKSLAPVALKKQNESDNQANKFQIKLTDKTPEQSQRSASSLDYGASYNQINMLGGDHLHDLGYKGQNMVIAVIDAGFYNVNSLPAFDSIRNNGQILGTWDFVQNEESVYEDDTHGMMVLSTIGANMPGQLIGTAPKAKFWLLRSEDAPTENIIEEYNWVAAAEFADSVGADIINSSLGYTTFDDPSQDHSYADMNGNTAVVTKGADMAASKGIFVVNSAGNSGNGSWYYIGAPADGDSVFSIGAVNAASEYASFSSKGPSSDGRVKPNVAAQGSGTVVSSTSGGIQYSGGTSFSSPIIAGMSACLWQAFPGLTNMELYRVIQESASQFNNPDEFLGYGIPNYSLSLSVLSGISVNESVSDPLLGVYPNPFTNNLKLLFHAPDTHKLIVSLYDATGKRIFNAEYNLNGNAYNDITINLPSDMQKGLYILQMNSDEKNFSRKIVKY